MQGQNQDFTRGGAQTWHGSWGCTDDRTLAARLLLNCCALLLNFTIYIYIYLKSLKLAEDPGSSDYTITICRGAGMINVLGNAFDLKAR